MDEKVRQSQTQFPSTLLSFILILSILLLSAANAATHKVPLNIIEGDYQCKNLLRGYNPQLSINLTPTVTPYADRFYIFQLLFSDNSHSIPGLTKGYMLYDVQTHTAVNHLDNNNAPGLVYFQLSDPQKITFKTYFLEPSLNKVGEYYCEKES